MEFVEERALGGGVTGMRRRCADQGCGHQGRAEGGEGGLDHGGPSLSESLGKLWHILLPNGTEVPVSAAATARPTPHSPFGGIAGVPH
ncbi:hypothetical protein MKOR_11680 [Mycolicibacillus koreensis]|nr:hypothetical protein MKOR_11680 [Mycolicibacillus koreensis]